MPGAAFRFDPLRLVSVADSTTEPSATPNGDSFAMQLAADGGWVLFVSDASNVSQDRHRGPSLDLYLYDRISQHTTLISVAAVGGEGGDGNTVVGRATPDARYVAFESEAGNLVPDGDLNSSSDVFVRDVLAGNTRLISINSHGTAAGLGNSTDPVITPDGRYIAFTSLATDLVTGDRNGRNDVLLTTVHPSQIVDTDNDGMDDDWELDYLGGLGSVPEADPDLDSISNFAEYTAGTDPLDPLSHLRIEIAFGELQEVWLYWTAAPGRTYVVESTVDLGRVEWSATPGIVRRTGGLAQFAAMESGEAPAYYRLRIAIDAGP